MGAPEQSRNMHQLKQVSSEKKGILKGGENDTTIANLRRSSLLFLFIFNGIH